MERQTDRAIHNSYIRAVCMSVKGKDMGWRSRVVEVGSECSQTRRYLSWTLKYQ